MTPHLQIRFNKEDVKDIVSFTAATVIITAGVIIGFKTLSAILIHKLS